MVTAEMQRQNLYSLPGVISAEAFCFTEASPLDSSVQFLTTRIICDSITHLQSQGDTSIFDNIDIALIQSSYLELSAAI